MPRAAVILLLAVAMLSTGAWAGVVITTEQTGGRDGGAREMQLLLEPDRLKLPQSRGGIIYHAAQDKAWTYDDERKSYMEMTRQSMGEMRGQMDAAMAQMRQQLAGMPPEQRKMVEEMMAKQGGGAMGQQPAAPADVTFQKAGARKTVGKWSCEAYTKLEDGRKTEDLCIARLGDLGLNRNDLKALDGLSAMMQASGPRAGQAPMDFAAMSKAVGYDAMPVHSVRYLPNGATIEITVKAVERKSLAASLFELPAGYARQEMPRMPGAPPGR